MAVPFVENYNGDGSNRIFTVISPILSESHVRVDFYYEEIIGEGATDHQISSGNWDIINNSVVFRVPPALGYVVKISVSSDGEGLDTSPSDVTNVAAKLNIIVELANKMSTLETVYSVSDALAALYQDKAELDAVYNTLDQIVFNATNIDTIAGAEGFADDAQLLAWVSEANSKTADSFANEDHNVNVKSYTSNGDGTFTACDCEFFSAKHWQVEAQSVVGEELISSIQNNEAAIALNAEALANLATAQARIQNEFTPSVAELITTPEILDFVITTPTTDSNVFTLNEIDNTITFLTNTSINFMSSVTMESDTNNNVLVTFELIDVTTGLTVTSQEAPITIPKFGKETIPLNTLLTIGKDGVPEAPLTIRVEAKADVVGMSLLNFDSIVTSATAYDVSEQIEHAAIIGGIVDIEQGERLGLEATGRSHLIYGRVGELVTTTASIPFEDCIKANGSLLKRLDYPKLWEFAQISGNIVTETEWDYNGKMSYSYGIDDDTFRIPDYRGEFTRGWSDGSDVDKNRKLGTLQLGAIQSHNHPLQMRPIFYAGGSRWGPYPGSNEPWNNVSHEVGGDETRPRNGAVLYCIKYK